MQPGPSYLAILESATIRLIRLFDEEQDQPFFAEVLEGVGIAADIIEEQVADMEAAAIFLAKTSEGALYFDRFMNLIHRIQQVRSADDKLLYVQSIYGDFRDLEEAFMAWRAKARESENG